MGWSQPLVSNSWWKRSTLWASWMVLVLRESPGWGEFDGDSDLVPASDYRLSGVRAQQMDNDTYRHFSPGESCTFSSYPEARQFSSSLCVPGAFWAASPALELRVSEFISKYDDQLELQQPSVSAGWKPHWFSQLDVMRTFVFRTSG